MIINNKMQEIGIDFRFVGARTLVSSHANGETSENQNRAGRKTPAGASAEFHRLIPSNRPAYVVSVIEKASGTPVWSQ